ncbi:MAG: hypothetical protein Q8P95_02820 [bacterium]|nr:hypothetical protein [bacterium]
MSFHFDFADIYPKYKPRVIRDVNPRLSNPNNIRLLTPVSFLQEGEDHIHSVDMLERARRINANLGQHDLEFLFRYQECIPSEWHFQLVAPGTVWEETKHEGESTSKKLRRAGLSWLNLRVCFVPVLCWEGDGWAFDFRSLSLSWGGISRLLSRPAKKL